MVKANKKRKGPFGKKATPRPAEPYRVKSWAAGWGGLINIVLLFVTLEIAVLSVEQAHWISPQPSLTLTLLLSVLAAWLLKRSRLPGALSHVLAIAAGALVTLWQGFSLMTAPDFGSRISQLSAGIQSWWQASGTVPAGTENLSFAVFLVALTWLIGYAAAWLLIQRRTAWAGVFLGALVILVNLSNLPDGYYVYLGLFILASAVLISHARMTKQPDAARYSRKAWAYIGTALLCAVVLAGSIAWFMPEARIPRLETMVATHTLWSKDIQQSKLNFFNAVPAKQPVNASSTHEEQNFTGQWHENDKIDFIVRSSRPSYWRVHIYDVYTAGGWENSPANDFLLDQKVPWGGAELTAGTTYTVSTNLKTDILLMGGSFLSSDNPTLVAVSAGDVIAVRMPRILRPGEAYAVTSRMSTPSPEELSKAPGTYSEEITNYYLQLPAGFPQNVRQLARQVTRGAATPYDKVLAVNKYLSKIPYSSTIGSPPGNMDGVENFLFQQKTGFCLYYASAMSVMLRSVGVPTRLAVGYLPGEPGKEVGEYILRDKHYHAWPQVYFNGYGWIDLEATPGGTASGVAIDTPWVSGDAITQLPIWDVWDNVLPPEIPYDLPGNAAAEAKPVVDPTPGGPLFFADELGVTLAVIFVMLVILIVLAAPVLLLRSSFYRWLWHVNRDDLASLAYDKMCHLAAMVGLGPRPQQTPMEFAAVLAAEFPEQAGAFDHVARSYMENRFGRKRGLELFEEAELLKARCSAFDTILTRLGLAGKVTRGRY